MVAASRIILIKNDNILQIEGLRDAIDNTYLNAATVNVTLERRGGANVLGSSWPLTMSYVAGSNGVYRATLPAGLKLKAEDVYFAIINAISAGKTGHWEFRVVATTRTG